MLGYLKDVEADRATGYDTLPVRFGRPRAVAASAAFCAVGLAGSLATLASRPARTRRATVPRRSCSGRQVSCGSSRPTS